MAVNMNGHGIGVNRIGSVPGASQNYAGNQTKVSIQGVHNSGARGVRVSISPVPQRGLKRGTTVTIGDVTEEGHPAKVVVVEQAQRHFPNIHGKAKTKIVIGPITDAPAFMAAPKTTLVIGPISDAPAMAAAPKTTLVTYIGPISEDSPDGASTEIAE